MGDPAYLPESERMLAARIVKIEDVRAARANLSHGFLTIYPT